MKTSEEKIAYRLAKTDLWALRRARFDKLFSPLRWFETNVFCYLPTFLRSFGPFFLFLPLGYLASLSVVFAAVLGMLFVYIFAMVLLPMFAGWREAQNYAAIGSIPRVKSSDEALERRIASGLMYGRDYSNQE